MKTFYLDRSKIEIPQNPPLKFAKEMVKKVRGYDKIVSIGGGSTIDVGKYISLKLKIPHKAIPTTAGTGSEVTKFAVFTKNGKKFSLEDEKLIPDEFEHKPKLLNTLPKLYKASSMLDSLSQSVESYLSPNATNESQLYSLKGILLILKRYKVFYEKGVGGLDLLKAAQFSGKAINITKTGICHAISYPLTIHYGIQHGIGCAMTLCCLIKNWNFRFLDKTHLMNMMKELDVDKYFSILKEVDIDLVIDEAFKSERINNCIYTYTKKELKNILKSIWEIKH